MAAAGIALPLYGCRDRSKADGNGVSSAGSETTFLPDQRTLNTVVSFLGALFGRELSDTDAAELIGRLTYAINAERVFAKDYTVLAGHVDQLAQNADANNFIAAAAPVRESIVDEIMKIDHRSLIARVMSHLSHSKQQYYRMRWWTVPNLEWLYRHSGVAWRARGYHRWPGIPGDWHEYITAGSAYP